jgi:hypothetical protein
MQPFDDNRKRHRRLAFGAAAGALLVLIIGYALSQRTQPDSVDSIRLTAPGTAFAECAPTSDPPACIVTKAASIPGVGAQELLEAVIATGSVEIIERESVALIDGAQAELSAAQRFLAAIGVQADPGAEQAGGSSSDVMLAAVALAAAAQRTDDPFDNPTVESLIARAGRDDRIAQIAVMLWEDFDVYGDWNSSLARPRGLERIWEAVLARPPADNEVLSELVTTAAFASTSRDYGLPLLRLLVSRPTASPDAKAQAASLLARVYRLPDEAQRTLDAAVSEGTDYDVDGIEVEIAEARLHRGSDARAAQVVVVDRVQALSAPAFHSYLIPSGLEALEAGGARLELRRLGEAYLRQARQQSGNAEDTGQWFALASDCFRRAGDSDATVSAAREGLPFVARAVAARNVAPVGRTPLDRQRAAVRANDFGTEPVLALYRAGARREAIQFGYLSGYQRYQVARETGEQIDVQAIVDDQSLFHLKIIVRSLIEAARTERVEQVYRGLPRSEFVDVWDEYQGQLGLLAAVARRETEMQAHFSDATEWLDRTPSEGAAATAMSALALAADWRRAQTMLARIHEERAGRQGEQVPTRP